MFKEITPQEAKKIMDTHTDYVILDVRRPDEFQKGHIPGAILIPHNEIPDLAYDRIPDKDKLVLVYCRSGRRSKFAAQLLSNLGYTNIMEFGGILDWPYETTLV